MSQFRKSDLISAHESHANVAELPGGDARGQNREDFSQRSPKGNATEKLSLTNFFLGQKEIHREPLAQLYRGETEDQRYVQNADRRADRNWRRDTQVPDKWDGAHFMLRLIGAYKTLALTPRGKNFKPMEFQTSWPRYRSEFSDLVARQDADEDDKEFAAKQRNFTRPVPTREDLTQMDVLFDVVYDGWSDDQNGSSMLMTWAYARYRNISVVTICDRYAVPKKRFYKTILSVASDCSERLNARNVRPF